VQLAAAKLKRRRQRVDVGLRILEYERAQLSPDGPSLPFVPDFSKGLSRVLAIIVQPPRK
jgi:hypothetical protein